MAVSLIAAFILPFEVFLFSYAILGPLHYLTEISWLHDRKYFSPRRWDVLPLIIFAVLFMFGSGSMVLGEENTAALKETALEPILSFLELYSYDLTFLSFGLALLFILSKDWRIRLGGAIVLLLAAYMFHAPEALDEEITNRATFDRYLHSLDKRSNNFYYSAFAVYMPTLIHVYVFTGAFILFGALKRDSRSGYLSFGFFLFCAIACFIILPDASYYTASNWALESYNGGFRTMSSHLLIHFEGMDWNSIFKMGSEDEHFILHNNASILFARFIAFAYTYHYLNWFSKTSIIRWHKVPKLRFAGVCILYAASIALYIYDYTIGFQWLFLLSFAHVVLEFPLNHQSFMGIGTELRKRLSGGAKPAKS